jgi:hypothetical protein
MNNKCAFTEKKSRLENHRVLEAGSCMDLSLLDVLTLAAMAERSETWRKCFIRLREIEKRKLSFLYFCMLNACMHYA